MRHFCLSGLRREILPPRNRLNCGLSYRIGGPRFEHGSVGILGLGRLFNHDSVPESSDLDLMISLWKPGILQLAIFQYSEVRTRFIDID